MTRSHRRRLKPKPLTKAQRALMDWLAMAMADPVVAPYAMHVVGLHAGLVLEIHEAELNSIQLAVPQRRHLGDPRDINRQTGIGSSSDPDDAMIAIIDRRLFGHGRDPEHLEPVRIAMTNRLGKEAAWYVDAVGEPQWAKWYALALRLGRLIGDQIAGNSLATSLACHARLAYSPDEQTQARRKAARERWRRLAAWYVRVLDEQPTRSPSDQAAERYQTVGPDGERRLG